MTKRDPRTEFNNTGYFFPESQLELVKAALTDWPGYSAHETYTYPDDDAFWHYQHIDDEMITVHLWALDDAVFAQMMGALNDTLFELAERQVHTWFPATTPEIRQSLYTSTSDNPCWGRMMQRVTRRTNAATPRLAKREVLHFGPPIRGDYMEHHHGIIGHAGEWHHTATCVLVGPTTHAAEIDAIIALMRDEDAEEKPIIVDGSHRVFSAIREMDKTLRRK